MNNSMVLRPISYIWLLIVLSVLYSVTSSDILFGDDGNQSTEKSKITKAPESVGCRLAPEIIALLEDEIKEGLKKRGIESRFTRFTSYAGRTLDSSADRSGWSEISGHCRLDRAGFTRLLSASVPDEWPPEPQADALPRCSVCLAYADLHPLPPEWMTNGENPIMSLTLVPVLQNR